LNLQGNRVASKGYIFYHTVYVHVSYLKINVQTFGIIIEFERF